MPREILRLRWPTRSISRPCYWKPLSRAERIMRIGVDLGGTKIEAIAIDGANEVLRRRVATPRGDYAATISAVRDLVAGIERELGAICTVGIGIPGAISA